jgi:hypothetical protein
MTLRILVFAVLFLLDRSIDLQLRLGTRLMNWYINTDPEAAQAAAQVRVVEAESPSAYVN